MKALKIFALLLIVTAFGCKDDDDLQTNEKMIDVGGGIELYTLLKGEGDKTVVFEAGLGSTAGVWLLEETFQNTSAFAEVIAYNRAGYAPSSAAVGTRDLDQLQYELGKIIEQRASNDKVILVGHSWGGPIIRAFAVEHPDMIEGLIFLDPTHEDWKEYDQSEEEMLLEVWGDGPGIEEVHQLLEGIEYLSTLPNLPDVPVKVITGMNNPGMTAEERQNWYDAHANLGEGISDFEHITAENSGHFVMHDEPQLVLDAIIEVVEK